MYYSKHVWEVRGFPKLFQEGVEEHAKWIPLLSKYFPFLCFSFLLLDASGGNQHINSFLVKFSCLLAHHDSMRACTHTHGGGRAEIEIVRQRHRDRNKERHSPSKKCCKSCSHLWFLYSLEVRINDWSELYSISITHLVCLQVKIIITWLVSKNERIGFY